MDEILAKASNQAITFAIRSGFSIASGYAIRTMTKMMDSIPATEKTRLVNKKNSLQRRIDSLNSCLDLLELAAARGNSALEVTMELVEDLRHHLTLFDQGIAALEEDLALLKQSNSVAVMESQMDTLSSVINEAIPLINLSLTTCGVNFANIMQPRMSPSRLLQAANRINASNIAFMRGNGSKEIQVGPEFPLSFYSVFYNPSRLKYIEEESETLSKGPASELSTKAISWKEEFPLATVKIIRQANAEFQYVISIKESFDDGRYHEDDETPRSRLLPVLDIQKQYFSASGELLRLEGDGLPVLVLKVLKDGVPEYLALGETLEDECCSDSEDLDSSSHKQKDPDATSQKLLLLEYLIRLCALQGTQQCSILEIDDETLFLYLQDEVDKAVLPQSRESRESAASKSFKTNQMLRNDSNINRLSKLTLEDA